MFIGRGEAKRVYVDVSLKYFSDLSVSEVLCQLEQKLLCKVHQAPNKLGKKKHFRNMFYSDRTIS